MSQPEPRVSQEEIDALDGTDPRSAVPPPPPKLCADDHAGCEVWAGAGECESNPGYMRATCAGSCGTCDEAKGLATEL